MNHKITNALTVDVEDYYQVAAFFDNVKASEWNNYESRVRNNTHKILEMFERHDYKATFFILGWVAEKHPEIVKEIQQGGHEIACHGYSHRLIYEQSPEVFKAETLKAKQLLEDISQQPVNGYRAASYSITKDSMWALDILAEAGFAYDSSIFPVRHDRYGIPGAEDKPHVLTTPSGHKLVEFPISTKPILGYRLPIGGGGYFRIYPYAFSRMFLKSVNNNHRPFIFYLHPWEVDPEQPRIEASWFSKFRHYNNLEKCEQRLENLLKDFKFSTVEDVLTDLGLLNASQGNAAA